MRNDPAKVETLKEAIVVARMRNHRTAIVITPPTIDFLPKKTNDQRAFSASWAQNKVKAILATSLANPFRQTRKTDTPIRT